ncbi:MAG: type II toxin-antitoxin system RelE/ParE family toxin [Candidatus Dadabacteria bacterium]|nr:type II toxin-antitoxin system RelE/ParE family toxin [Candidatus Dadabacteria bacterium]MDE0663620.1 type II toxin-antitoxin system RelE/ParE family toxin [Candidatus Dadabacteria bacterium]
MSYEIRFHEEAEMDLADSALWYEFQRSGLGDEFLEELLLTIRSVQQHPFGFPIVHRGVRRALIKRFPFGIFYRVEPEFIVIFAVMHASRHPLRWQSRM